jgi:iron complex transport system substrate-binding protein
MIKIESFAAMCLVFLIMIGSAENVTVIDSTGCAVTVDAPVHKVVSLGTGVAGYIYALDEGECLIGRDSYSYYPPELTDVQIAGKSSYSPDLELIVKLQPDLVIADTMLSDEDKKELEDAGIPVLLEWISDPSKDVKVMEDIGLLLGKKDRAREIIDVITEYRNLIKERTASLKDDEKAKGVFGVGRKALLHSLQRHPNGHHYRPCRWNQHRQELRKWISFISHSQPGMGCHNRPGCHHPDKIA